MEASPRSCPQCVPDSAPLHESGSLPARLSSLPPTGSAAAAGSLEISAPRGFRHVGHLGRDPDGTYDLSRAPPELRAAVGAPTGGPSCAEGVDVSDPEHFRHVAHAGWDVGTRQLEVFGVPGPLGRLIRAAGVAASPAVALHGANSNAAAVHSSSSSPPCNVTSEITDEDFE
eukprot:m51a1_g2163 hypothetical protein (172) ;mRNA; r:45529-47661